MKCVWKKVALATLVASALCSVAGEAAALGFGTPSSRTLLGAPLRVSMPLHFSSTSDEVGDECLTAEVYFGDVRVSQEQVSAIVKHLSDTDYALLIGTSVPVNEPVVTVNLRYGCTTSYARQFIVLADPPLDTPSVPVTAPVEPAADAAGRGASGSGMPTVAGSVTIPPATVEPVKPRAPHPRRAEPKVVQGMAVPAAVKVAESTSSARPEPAKPKPASKSPKVAPQAKAAGPHLQLDPVDAQPLDPLTLGRSVPVTSAGSAVKVGAPASAVAVAAAPPPSQADAPLQLRMEQDQQRMDDMEKRIAALNAEVAALKSRPSGYDRATGLLAALAFLAIVTSGVLFVQWRREKQTRELLQS